MIPELQIFTNCDFEPWAVFYFGTHGYGLTKEKAIEAYVDMYDPDWLGDEPEYQSYSTSEPKLFYIYRTQDDDVDDEEGFSWHLCEPDHEEAVACFGVIFE